MKRVKRMKDLQKTKGSYLPHSARVAFDKWNLAETNDHAIAFLEAMAKDAFEIATKEYECNAWFPLSWKMNDSTYDGRDDGIGGRCPEYPGTIYVGLPLGPDEDEHPTWSFRLDQLVIDFIEGAEMGDGGPIGDDDRPNFIALRNEFARMVAAINEALARKEK